MHKAPANLPTPKTKNILLKINIKKSYSQKVFRLNIISFLLFNFIFKLNSSTQVWQKRKEPFSKL